MKRVKRLWKKLRWRLYRWPTQAQDRLKKWLSLLGWTMLLAIVLTIAIWAIWPDKSPGWTGFGAYDPSMPRAKTLWDWMGLMIVPIGLALTAIWFNQRLRDTEFKIADERLKEETLQSYFDKMSELLLTHNLYKAEKNDDVRFIARARTLSTLRQLDSDRKGIVLEFLRSLRLTDCSMNEIWEIRAYPIISLSDADLTSVSVSSLGGNWGKVNLRNLLLQNADLSKANLHGADLSETILFAAWLADANLRNCMLCGADLRLAFLIDANLQGTDLSRANLTNTTVTADQLKNTKSLKDCIMPSGERYDPNKTLSEQCKLQITGDEIIV